MKTEEITILNAVKACSQAPSKTIYEYLDTLYNVKADGSMTLKETGAFADVSLIKPQLVVWARMLNEEIVEARRLLSGITARNPVVRYGATDFNEGDKRVLGTSSKPKSFPIRNQEFIDVWYGQKVEEALKAVRARAHLFTKEGDAPERLLSVLTSGKYNQLDLAVFKHFMWQVKRKMLGLEVYDHMFINFYGPQGVGKTTALRAWLQSYLTAECYTNSLKIKQALDPKIFKKMGHTFVCQFDELATGDRTDIADLKQQITSHEMESRVHHTHTSQKVSQNCTFIGTSNIPLFRIFIDSTGMRRFYEIRMMKPIDWAELHKIDMTTVWNEIDAEGRDAYEQSYLHPVRQELAVYQEGKRQKSATEEFMGELGLEPGDKRLRFKPLWEAFAQFCKDTNAYGRNSAMRKIFKADLEELYKIEKDMKIKQDVIYVSELSFQRLKALDKNKYNEWSADYEQLAEEGA